MSIDIESYLSDLDHIVDPEWAKKAEQRISRSLNYEEVDYLPVGFVYYPSKPLLQMDPREYVWEKEKALLYRLNRVRDGALLRDDRILTVGKLPDASLIPTMFNASLHIRKMLHWVEPAGDREYIERIIKNGVPDVLDGWGWKVLKELEFFLEALGNYPNLRQSVKVSFGMQGPFGTAYQVAGSDINYWLYDAPELVEALVDLMTETQLAWYDTLKKYFKTAFKEGRLVFSAGSRANVYLSFDYCENISPDMYERFSKPFNEKIFAKFDNKGAVHFCGNNEQIQKCILDTPGVVYVDFRDTKPGERYFEQKINLLKKRKIGFQYNHSEAEVIRKGGPEGISTGIYQVGAAETFDKAKDLLKYAKGN